MELVRATLDEYRPTDTSKEVAQLATLCARLPLALRIAAERAAARPLMPLGSLIEDLREESSLWDALSSDDESDAVRSVFAWSYRTLPPETARLFRLLGLHPGPDISVGAAAALRGGPERATRQLLDHLAGAHLLEQVAPDRYQFHDLLRAYAADHVQSDEPASVRAAFTRMFSWFLHTAAAAVGALQTFFPAPAIGPLSPGVRPQGFGSAGEANAWYEEEAVNLRAVARSAADLGLDDIVWQVAAVLDPIHGMRNPFDDWFFLGELGLASARRCEDRQAEALMRGTLGVACSQSGRLDEAVGHLGAAAALHRATGNVHGELASTNALGWVHLRARQLAEAAAQFEATDAAARVHGVGSWRHIALCNLSTVRLEAGDLGAAADCARRFLDSLRAAGGDRRLEFDGILNLARVAREQGDFTTASGHLDAALSIARETSPYFRAVALFEEGRLHGAAGRFEDAVSDFQECASLYRGLPDGIGEARVFDAVGEVYRENGLPERAAELHRLAAARFDRPVHGWDLAVACANLAMALKDRGHLDGSARCRSRALSLLTGFTDRRAAALRERLHSRTTAG